MNQSKFEALLNVKQKDLDLKKLADDISADFLKNIKDKHETSRKILLAYKKLKTAKFRKFCRLIPLSYSAGMRHVKVAEFMQEDNRTEKLKHIDSWDTLHALSLLNKFEYWYFMHEVGNKGEHFTKAEVEKYNRGLRKKRLQNDASKIVRNSSWLTIGNSYATREDYKRDLEKVYKFVKKLPSIEVYDDFESAMEKVKTLKQAEIEVNEHEITENRWYIVRLNENIEKLEAELRVPDADRDGITEKLMKYQQSKNGLMNCKRKMSVWRKKKELNSKVKYAPTMMNFICPKCIEKRPTISN